MSMLPVGAHVTLDRPDGALGVGDGLALGDFADQHLAVLGEGDDRRGGARPLGVGDDDGFARFQHGDHRVGGPEVDSDGLTHGYAPCHWSGPVRANRLFCLRSVGTGTARGASLTFLSEREYKS